MGVLKTIEWGKRIDAKLFIERTFLYRIDARE